MTTPSNSPLKPYDVSVKSHGAIGLDTELNFTGPGAGVSAGAGETNTKGLFTVTGNRIVINEVSGADSIEIVHFTDAQIIIDPDGSIFLIPSSKKGFGINSVNGDGVVAAKNTLVLKGVGSIICETEGDLQFNVGKNCYFNVGGDFITKVNGSVNQFIEGSVIKEVVGDDAKIVAGSNRLTVAGNYWNQVSGNCNIDVKMNCVFRSNNTAMQTKDSFEIKSEKKIALASSENISAVSDSVNVSAKNETKILGDNLIVSGKSSAKFVSDGTADVSGKPAKINSGGTLDLAGSPVRVSNPVTGNPSTPLGPGPNPLSAESISEREEIKVTPVVASSNTVIDSVTTIRRNPEISMNMRRTPGSEISILQNEGGNISQEAKKFQNLNSRNNENTTTDVPMHDPIPNSKKAEKTTLPALTSIHNSNERLSRLITVGMFPGINKIPESFRGISRTQILENIQNLCFNILDPVFSHFGNRVSFTTLGGWRPESNNHNTGRAADIRAANRDDHALTAEIAAWVRDNLPYSKILLEKNNYGSIHVHVESQQPGGTAGGTVITCSDPACRVSVQGLQLQFAQAALRGNRGTA